MLRRITVSCIVVLYCCSFSAQEQHLNSVRFDELKGNVRSVESRMTKTGKDTTRFYQYYEHLIIEVNSLLEYDSSGFRYHSIYYEEGKSPLEGFESYDENERVLTFNFFRGGKTEYGTKRRFLGDGSAVEQQFEKGQLIEESILSYDRFGRVILKETVLKRNDEFESKEEYHVDSLNQLVITTTTKDNRGDLVCTTVEKIDSLVRYVYTSDQFYSDSQIFWEYSYYYDTLNRLIAYEYGDKASGMPKERIDFGYNTNGDCIEYKRSAGEQLFETVKMEYKYDDQGNWIEQQIFVNGAADGIIHRVICYYK
ncbi:MAG: hypothetical protein QE487_11875 [Fluviicola sp.]|nr:hypothetical protein [Fluviicola sp.]